jgi:fucose permease
VWFGIFLFILYTGAEGTAGNWGVGLFDSRGIDLAIANNWISAYWLSFTVGRIFFGAIITRLNTDTTIRLCLVAATAAGILMMANPSELLSGVGIVVYGFALSPIFALMISLTQARLGPVHGPNAIAASVAAAGIGAGILPAVVGVAVRLTNFEIVPLILVGMAAGMLVLYQVSMAQGFKVKVATAD